MLTKDRANEVCEKAKQISSMFWMEKVSDLLTNEELAYVNEVWDKMSDNTCWWDAFNKIRMGRNVGT